jgi:hypothetical protein
VINRTDSSSAWQRFVKDVREIALTIVFQREFTETAVRGHPLYENPLLGFEYVDPGKLLVRGLILALVLRKLFK